MCGQFEALLYLKMLDRRIEEDAQTRKVVPGEAADILIHNAEAGRVETIEARFGLIPHWHRGGYRDFKGATFNARLETVAEKPVFKGAWRYRRAIVPAVSFGENSGPKAGRQSWRITRRDGEPMGFAAIWDEAGLVEGELLSFAILTRPAGPDMAAIHEREPVILPVEAWDDWMTRKPVDLETPTPLTLVNETPAAQLGLF